MCEYAREKERLLKQALEWYLEDTGHLPNARMKALIEAIIAVHMEERK